MIKSSIIYLISSLIVKAVPFLLLPFLTTHLSPSEFGLVAIIQLTIQFSQSFSGLSLNVNIPRKYFSQDKSKNAVLIFNMYAILLGSSFVLFTMISVFIMFDTALFNIPSSWLLAMPILAFMGMSNLINLTLSRTRERPIEFLGLEVSHAVLNLSLTVFFIAFVGMSWEGRVIAIALSMFFFGLVGIIYLIKEGYIKGKLDIAVIRDVLSISIPLIPHAIAGIVISVSDRFFIEHMIGLEVVGIYTVGYYFGMVIMLFSDAFVKAWTPWFFRKMNLNLDKERREIVKLTYVYILLLVVVAILYSLLAVFILPYVVAEEYYGASVYIPWICAGYVFFGVYQIYFPYLVYSKKTSYVAVATVLAALINLVGNYYFIGIYGAIGAAYATILAFIVSSIVVMMFAMKLVEMPWLGVTRECAND